MPGRPVFADPLELAKLQESQEQALHVRAAVADLVEHHGSAMRAFEDTPVITDGTGETSPDVAEQFGFEEGVGNTGAADRTKRP